MIRAIVAMDSKHGLADDSGIPWRLPDDRKYFEEHTILANIVMGYNTYLTLIHPLRNRRNYVICEPESILRDGFNPVYDVDSFLTHLDETESTWVIGGAATYAQTLKHCTELYITQLQQDFHCTKYFPEFTHQFALVSESELQRSRDSTFTYQIFQRK